MFSYRERKVTPGRRGVIGFALMLLMVGVPGAVLAGIPGTGFVEICKMAAGPGVSGTFTFTVGSQTVSIPAGACSAPIAVTAGTVTVTEEFRPGIVVTDITTSPAARLISRDLGGRTATVAVVEGDSSTQTVVTFANTFEWGQLKLCKIAGPGVTVGTNFSFLAGDHAFTVPAGPAPGGFCATAGTFPAGVGVAVSELIPDGMEVTNITVAPPDRITGTPNLAAGRVAVAMGTGVTEVVFTNRSGSVTTTTTVPATTTTVSSATTTTVAAATTTVPGPTTTAAGVSPTTAVPGSTTTAPGATTTVPGVTTTSPGATTTLPGATTLPAGVTTTVPGAVTTSTVPGAVTTTTVSGVSPTTSVQPTTTRPASPSTTAARPTTTTTAGRSTTTTTAGGPTTTTTTVPGASAPTTLPGPFGPPGGPLGPRSPHREVARSSLAITGSPIADLIPWATLTTFAGALLFLLGRRRPLPNDGSLRGPRTPVAAPPRGRAVAPASQEESLLLAGAPSEAMMPSPVAEAPVHDLPVGDLPVDDLLDDLEWVLADPPFSLDGGPAPALPSSPAATTVTEPAGEALFREAGAVHQYTGRDAAPRPLGARRRSDHIPLAARVRRAMAAMVREHRPAGHRPARFPLVRSDDIASTALTSEYGLRTGYETRRMTGSWQPSEGRR